MTSLILRRCLFFVSDWPLIGPKVTSFHKVMFEVEAHGLKTENPKVVGYDFFLSQ